MLTLQNMLADKPYDDLPPAWHDFNLTKFSETKKLWDYQKEALEYAVKALWKYYQEFEDYYPTEPLEINTKRKEKFWQWYLDNGFDENLDIPLDRQKRDVRALLEEYYPTENGRIPYKHFINRMSFWMATGSGKTLILIKLIEILWNLIQRGEIPRNDILVLTARDDLLEQLKSQIDDFNSGRVDFKIHLADLKLYPDMKHGLIPTIGEHGFTVFYYRADNLSDEQKERIVDFRNYDNQGRWYVLLDEAHKGDKEESKRQHIYSILARNGFLFNFSATFTDPRDIFTTVYDFNLARFVEAGYSKHITILKQEFRAFRDRDDFTGSEKQRVVLKSLIMLSYVYKAYEALPEDLSTYHRPMMLALVNSVNTEDADLKLFFKELERIGKGEVDEKTWRQAKEELWEELKSKPELLFEEGRFQPDKEFFDSITYEELLKSVYNATSSGEIEVLLRPSNKKEMAFKLKSSDQPFALIKIGDITNWIKEELEGYEIVEGYEDEGFFQSLNEDNSPINILMGSRSFYEGWDSNRPNVIAYINIGTGTEARKFILQSVGRGVRIEPLPGKRRRLQNLRNANAVSEDIYQKLKKSAFPLETLFIFGTNRNALRVVIEHLNKEKRYEAKFEISLELNSEVIEGHPLLIPVYRSADHTIIQARKPRKFEIADSELKLLRDYVEYLDDPRLLIVHHNAMPEDVQSLQKCLKDPDDYFNSAGSQKYGRLDILLSRLFAYFKVVPEEIEKLKLLDEEIRHFRHLKVILKDIRDRKDVEELQRKIEIVAKAPLRIRELRAKYEAHRLTFEEMLQQLQAIRENEIFAQKGCTLHIKRVTNHYYLPLILSDQEKIDYIQHVIRYKSEVQFINDLERYLEQGDNAFQQLDWWAFSKIDETLDEVYIPYYDPNSNRYRYFYPDFIFWLQKGTEYAVVFVDPKGINQPGYQYKVDGFKQIFLDEAGQPRKFSYNGLTVRIDLLLYTKDANLAPEGYREYWFDRISAIPHKLLMA